MKKHKIGLIGLGMRGHKLLDEVILNMERIDVTAVCDICPDRLKEASLLIEKRCGKKPILETDYKRLIDCENVDAVIVASAWESHCEIAVYAMEAKKPVAVEVGGVKAIEDCWALVDAYEKTKTPFMFLENCCFGRRELMAIHMDAQGLFGEIVHCAGGYMHDLRDDLVRGGEDCHYRFKNYKDHNCDNYPTHDLGPIAKLLDICCGNRLTTLTSTASKSRGLGVYIKDNFPDDKALNSIKFCQGDIITTVIQCERGESIVLTLDTTLPRGYYSRDFTVRGTEGMYEEATDSVYLTSQDGNIFCRFEKDEADDLLSQWEHPAWKEIENPDAGNRHRKMDRIELNAFLDCLENNEPMYIDVYDAATWTSVAILSELSIKNGSAPYAIPDFTRGKWKTRENIFKTKGNFRF